jgi:hypothetical protein
VNRTKLINAALRKLLDAVEMLSDAGEQKLAARLEDIIQHSNFALAKTTNPIENQRRRCPTSVTLARL